MMVDPQSLLERFLGYVRIESMAVADVDRYPSSDGQLQMGRLLVQELNDLGIEANQDEHGIVVATIPGNVPEAPVVALNAHVDTSPETSGANVRPHVVENYDGKDIALGESGIAITLQENPELSSLVGKTLITTDGTTLLGADDKAGVAIIMQVATTLVQHPEIPHGDVRILFTCDEEIGLGVKHVDVDALAADVCYTLDGGGAGDIDTETFSADGATVTIQGTNIHPSIAKDRMVNAVKAMSEFLVRLPRGELSPETTEGRDGFLHPYELKASVEQAVAKILLRDFDTSKLADYAELLRKTGKEVERVVPGCRVGIEVAPQYRNLGDGLKHDPRAVAFAEEAHRRLEKPFRLNAIRGGTDGSQLTALGLPTPNLSSGQHNPHSPREFACLDEMLEACDVVLELLKVWAGR